MLKKHRQLVFVLLLFLLYSLSPDYIGVGQTTRFDLTKAIVVDHSFVIDKYIENTIDWALVDGHYFTNKAPGLSFLAIPFYYLCITFEKILGVNPDQYDTLNFRISDSFVSALPNAILCIFLFYFLIGLNPKNTSKAWLISFTYAVATIAFPFSTMSWGHPTSGVFLFLSYYFITRKPSPKLTHNRSNTLAGLFFGLAVLIEYSCALVAPALVAYYFFEHKKHKAIFTKSLFQFVLGGLPILFIFGFYHKICFGGWLQLPHTFENPQFIEQEKLWGVLGVPSFKVLFDLLFSFQRGLFILSPILILSTLGFYCWLKDKKYKNKAIVALITCLIFWVFNGSFNGWHGGWSAGPRYLIPCLPFLTVALFWVKTNPLFKILLVISVVNIAAVAAVNTLTPQDYNLLFEQIYPNLYKRLPYFISILGFIVVIYRLCIESHSNQGQLQKTAKKL